MKSVQLAIIVIMSLPLMANATESKAIFKWVGVVPAANTIDLEEKQTLEMNERIELIRVSNRDTKLLVSIL